MSSTETNPVLIIDSLFGGSLSALEDFNRVDLRYVKRLALTVEAPYDDLSTRGVRIHVRSSSDGVNFDTEGYKTIELGLISGKAIRKTVRIPPNPPILKVIVENPDAVHIASDVKVSATVQVA